jgi:hypothetical protein
MQMLYNSDSFVVVRFDVPQAEADSTPQRGGYEIVDKFARKEIYLQGALADSFQRGVQAVVDAGPDEEAMDAFIAGWTALAQQPLASH